MPLKREIDQRTVLIINLLQNEYLVDVWFHVSEVLFRLRKSQRKNEDMSAGPNAASKQSRASLEIHAPFAYSCVTCSQQASMPARSFVSAFTALHLRTCHKLFRYKIIITDNEPP
ncbi:hypothetical protein MPTK1_2g02430 [Marchantia polymorpha subsp. ruderalis]|uniref:Uncharacterized protein n=1 Tax=Marchantia polymorpha TaxID=3197 RepID=A0A2R6WM00_MARPO|nr:hypothetical protein MARPO_0075s0002 [Marchantia polymorpha]PTQ34873.1 hypothetical protein MARPO_0075s0002 [Marchantia polymorpha]BBN00823.1 hypothetical protein Mp_2g02430 [Marchantia polymorpha subsp. ruderalis]BBN00824.1 hypothetical protein Mp_2g02430 [Marchantia polymorpha subsp. ruderalis]|eukprot:PTQ34872.1 hypothetical protein MARPO_0075s0002 [Marchantia polymorpha]